MFKNNNKTKNRCFKFLLVQRWQVFRYEEHNLALFILQEVQFEKDNFPDHDLSTLRINSRKPSEAIFGAKCC